MKNISLMEVCIPSLDPRREASLLITFGFEILDWCNRKRYYSGYRLIDYWSIIMLLILCLGCEYNYRHRGCSSLGPLVNTNHVAPATISVRCRCTCTATSDVVPSSTYPHPDRLNFVNHLSESIPTYLYKLRLSDYSYCLFFKA